MSIKFAKRHEWWQFGQISKSHCTLANVTKFSRRWLFIVGSSSFANVCYMNCTSKRFDLFLKVNGKYQLICQERRKLEPTLIKMSESCRSVLCMMSSFYSLLSTVHSATIMELVRQQEWNGWCITQIWSISEDKLTLRNTHLIKHTPNKKRKLIYIVMWNLNEINYSNVWIVRIENSFLQFFDYLSYDFWLRPRKKGKNSK